MKLLVERVTETIGVNEELEISFEELELGEIELDKGVVRNIRKTTDLLLEISDSNTEYIYDVAPRPRFEVSSGYRIATKRGARLHEAKVFNICFRFINRKIDGTAIATMFRPPNKNEEWILLLPDDTRRRIEIEKKEFLKEANSLIFKGLMSPDEQSFLIENLNLLSVNERCAQTLMHEYGHILHWRMFDAMNIYEEEKIYGWFYEHGYVQNLEHRLPYFPMFAAHEKLHILKECLVEDYRINLNRKAKGDMFVLPNRVTYRTDFAFTEFLFEGMCIMEKMLQPSIDGKTQIRKPGFETDSEIDTIKAIQNTRRWLELDPEWYPGLTRMTHEDHLAVMQRLREERLEKERANGPKLKRIK